LKPEVFPLAYLPDIAYMAHYYAASKPVIDIYEHFEKQTCRSRTNILTAQGRQTLSLPVSKKEHHTPVKEVKLSYCENWPQVHWRTIQTAYSSAPYFDFYAGELEAVYEQKQEFIADFTASLFHILCNHIGIPHKQTFSEKYIEKSDAYRDYRNYWHTTKDHLLVPRYWQVFSDKHGFEHNLSIIDLLFNMGPESAPYLFQLAQKLKTYYSG
jgi:hypothetical protein